MEINVPNTDLGVQNLGARPRPSGEGSVKNMGAVNDAPSLSVRKGLTEAGSAPNTAANRLVLKRVAAKMP
jgi:hypothetical protein